VFVELSWASSGNKSLDYIGVLVTELRRGEDMKFNVMIPELDCFQI